jgi:hypothetical protein
MSSGSELAAMTRVYPKVRPPLTPGHEQVYVHEYKSNRSARGLLFSTVAKLEAWMHREVSTPQTSGPILEIGAGTLNHVPYEPANVAYDVVEPFEALYTDSPHRDRIRKVYQYMQDVPMSAEYDRIVSVAVLEHLTDLPDVIARAGILLAPNGEFRAGIPTEGGALWGLSWRFTTGIAYRIRTGLPYSTVMRHEHVNDENEIVDMVRCFFSKVRIKRFPMPCRHLSFYTAIFAAEPVKNVCLEWLAGADERNRVAMDRKP